MQMLFCYAPAILICLIEYSLVCADSQQQLIGFEDYNKTTLYIRAAQG